MFEFAVNSKTRGGASGSASGRGLHPLLKASAAPLAVLIAAVLVAAGPARQALADPPGAPVANEVYGGCTYDPAALAAVLQINTSAFQDGAIVADYLIVLRTDTQNNGQELKHGNNQPAEYTGVVICVAESGKVASVSAEGVPIPNADDHPDATSVDIYATQGISVLQYRVNGGARNEDVENRVCPSTDTGIDCVLVQNSEQDQ